MGPPSCLTQGPLQKKQGSSEAVKDIKNPDSTTKVSRDDATQHQETLCDMFDACICLV